MPGWLDSLGMQAAGTVQDTLLGLAMEGHNDSRQLRQQGKLLEQQAGIDRKQAAFNQQLGLETWRQTGPVAMTNELKKAGLSPALQYGGAGGGGATTGGGSNSVGAAKAPSGGGEILGLQMMNAQRKLIEAQTQNVQADTAKKSGVDTNLTNQQARLATIQANLAAETYEETYKKIVDAAKIVANEAKVSDATTDEQIAIKEGELIGLGLSNEMKEAGIRLTEEQIKQTVESVKQAWKNLSIQEKNAVINGNRLELDKFIKDVPDSIKLTVETVKDVVNDIVDFKQQKRRQDWNERERTQTTSRRSGRGWSETTRTGNH